MDPAEITRLEKLAQQARLGPVDAVEAGSHWVLKFGYSDGSHSMNEAQAKYIAEAATSLLTALDEVKRLRDHARSLHSSLSGTRCDECGHVGIDPGYDGAFDE